MIIAPELLDNTVYQHKTPYRGVNQDNRRALGNTGLLTHWSDNSCKAHFRSDSDWNKVFPHLENSLESREQCGVRQYYRADRLVLPESYQPRVSKPGDSGDGVGNF